MENFVIEVSNPFKNWGFKSVTCNLTLNSYLIINHEAASLLFSLKFSPPKNSPLTKHVHIFFTFIKFIAGKMRKIRKFSKNPIFKINLDYKSFRRLNPRSNMKFKVITRPYSYHTTILLQFCCRVGDTAADIFGDVFSMTSAASSFLTAISRVAPSLRTLLKS